MNSIEEGAEDRRSRQYGATAIPEQSGGDAGYRLHQSPRSAANTNTTTIPPPGLQQGDGLFRSIYSDDEDDADSLDDDPGMSLAELLYSSSSYHAIAKPVTLTMILSALCVIYVNTEETLRQGEEVMAQAYQVFKTSDSKSTGQALAFSLMNSLIMVSVICGLTFVIVLLYRFRCMKCLIGYMVFASATLLGVLGGNVFDVAIMKYHIPIDKPTFYLIVYNFCVVGVVAVFWEQGVPKYITQGYLIATAVILAWQLTHFDAWTTWTLLFMLALYDLCAVLTPCGPLRALVNLMSEKDSPNMPGLLYEAELPPEARRPGGPRGRQGTAAANPSTSGNVPPTTTSTSDENVTSAHSTDGAPSGEGIRVDVPLGIARVYNLKIVAIPSKATAVFHPRRKRSPTAEPLLEDRTEALAGEPVNMPENPTTEQLRADVTVQLQVQGGRIEKMTRRGRTVYLERDRNGVPKRYVWVDRQGKVFSEDYGDDDDDESEDEHGNNSIRLGLGDFIFYSVLVGKAAQYSFATFCACMLVILAGLGGTLVLLSVYHHALPALPISIFLGVTFYVFTRLIIEPWIEAILKRPMYV